MERDVAQGRIATKRSKPRQQVPFGANGIFRGLHWSPACLFRQSFCSRAAHFGPPDFLDTRREHSTHRAASSEDASACDNYWHENVIKIEFWTVYGKAVRFKLLLIYYQTASLITISIKLLRMSWCRDFSSWAWHFVYELDSKLHSYVIIM